MFNKAEAVIYNPDSTYAEISQYIDVESFVKTYIIQELSKNIDACNSSFYIYYDSAIDNRLHAGPVWDFDNSFGQFKNDGRTIVEGRTITPATIKSQYERADGWMANVKGMNTNKSSALDFEAMLLSHGDVWSVLKNIWNGDNNNGFYSKAKAYANGIGEGTLSYYLNEVEKCGAMNESRWGLIEKNLLSNRYDTGSNFTETSEYLTEWINARLDWLNSGEVLSGSRIITDNSLTNLTPLSGTANPGNLSPVGNTFNGQSLYIMNVASTKGVCVHDDPSYAYKDRNVVVGGRSDTADKYNNHKWLFEYQDDGTYKIKNVKYEKYLTVFGAISEEGRMNVSVEANNDSDSQKWYILDLGDGQYALRAKSTNAVLDVYGAQDSSIKDGSNVATHGYGGTPAQKFTISTT